MWACAWIRLGRGLEGQITDPDEKLQFTLMIGNFINAWNVLYDLHEEGELPNNQWELLVKDIPSVYSTRGVWEQVGRHAMNQSSVKAVEKILADTSAAYSFFRQSIEMTPTNRFSRRRSRRCSPVESEFELRS